MYETLDRDPGRRVYLLKNSKPCGEKEWTSKLPFLPRGRLRKGVSYTHFLYLFPPPPLLKSFFPWLGILLVVFFGGGGGLGPGGSSHVRPTRKKSEKPYP